MVTASPASSSPRTGWDDLPWGRFRSRRFALWISFPDGKNWRIDDHRNSWLLATHPPSSSSLSLRVYQESEAVNPARCEARARQHDPRLPSESSGKILERSAAPVIKGWDTRSLVLSVLRSRPGEPLDLEGHRVVIASSVRKCMVIHYATRAVGAGAEGVLGARLAESEELVSKIEPWDGLQGPGAEPLPFEK
ncbi:MAG: hypothetical protein RMJ98_15095 [Myxococcales bacterium]|nr:hypothetical protein [Myxococcales bacterium]